MVNIHIQTDQDSLVSRLSRLSHGFVITSLSLCDASWPCAMKEKERRIGEKNLFMRQNKDKIVFTVKDQGKDSKRDRMISTYMVGFNVCLR